MEEILLKEKIPYTIYSGVQFFARAEIKDALSYLRMIACRDDLSFLRIANVPKRNLGERRMAFLKDYAAQNGCSLYDALRRNLDSELLRGTKGGKFVSLIESFTGIYDQMPVSELLAAVLNESGYEAMLRTEGSQMRLDNLAELKQSVYAYETTCGEECTLEHYLAHVALFTNADLDDPRDQVRLMTVHSAKGLEFPHVFLCAMNEGIFPSKKTRTLPGMEEERRLCFVAMTRAQKALYLSEAEGAIWTAARAIRRASCWRSTIHSCNSRTPRARISSGRRGNTSAFPPDFWTKAACRRASPPARGSVMPSSGRARFWSLTPRRGRSWCSSIPCPLRACSLCAQSWNGSEPSGRGWFRAVTL